MENILLEEIERFKLLSGYNTDKTLSENYILLEDGLFGRVLQNLTRAKVFDDAAIALKELPMFRGGGDDAAKTFLTDLRAGGKSLSKEQLQVFQKELLGNKTLMNTSAKDLVAAAAEGYAKQLAKSQGKQAIIFRNASLADKRQLLLNNGYSKNGAEQILQQYAKVEKELAVVGGKQVAQAAETGVKDATQAAAETAAQTAAQQKGRLKQMADTLGKYKDKLINSLKVSGWKKTLAVAAGLGVGGAALWAFANQNNVKPADMPKEAPVETTTPPVNDGSTDTRERPSGSVRTGYTIPTELGDVAGVQKFQTWLDEKHPGWHKKYGTLGGSVAKGFGKFGPNTSAAWNNQEWRNEYLGGATTTQTTNTGETPSDVQGVEDVQTDVNPTTPYTPKGLPKVDTSKYSYLNTPSSDNTGQNVPNQTPTTPQSPSQIRQDTRQQIRDLKKQRNQKIQQARQ